MAIMSKAKSCPKLVPFKIYADFESTLEIIKSYEGSYLKNIKITFLVFVFYL